MSARYITTALPYVNAKPHLGHALEAVAADAYARSLRLAGEEVFFNVGTDEHGAKILAKAEEAGVSPKAYTDGFAAIFKAFYDRLNVSYDSFIRTTDPHHIQAAQEFWKRCDAVGDIYKAAYEVKYCTGCELEKTDSELVDGRCPLHANQEIDIRTEENYYFRFSKYQDALLARYNASPAFVIPAERQNEIRSFVQSGLKDFSISRPREKLSWGVPVPGDETQTMYVWFDALVNYVSVIGWPENQDMFSKWWPVTQFAGKDNLRQQSAMWQAMLLSAGLPFSKEIYTHGYLISGGQKMSKSLGNVIDPMTIVERYGTDTLRYVLLRHAHPFEDSDITEASIAEWYTANLVNGLGNLVARVMKLAETHLAAPVHTEDKPLPSEFVAPIEHFEFQKAIDSVWARIQAADERITKEEPFKLVKVDAEKGKQCIRELTEEVYGIACTLAPFMPATSNLIQAAVKENKKPENLFPRLS